MFRGGCASPIPKRGKILVGNETKHFPSIRLWLSRGVGLLCRSAESHLTPSGHCAEFRRRWISWLQVRLIGAFTVLFGAAIPRVLFLPAQNFLRDVTVWGLRVVGGDKPIWTGSTIEPGAACAESSNPQSRSRPNCCWLLMRERLSSPTNRRPVGALICENDAQGCHRITGSDWRRSALPQLVHLSRTTYEKY